MEIGIEQFYIWRALNNVESSDLEINSTCERFIYHNKVIYVAMRYETKRCFEMSTTSTDLDHAL